MSDAYARATNAYASSARGAADQRRLEADLLLKAARQLEDFRTDFRAEQSSAFDEALLYNRKLWTIFASEAADGADRLPHELRNSIGSLAVFVFKRTFELMATPDAGKVEALIEINRNVATGLLSRPQTAVATTTAGDTAQAV